MHLQCKHGAIHRYKLIFTCCTCESFTAGLKLAGVVSDNPLASDAPPLEDPADPEVPAPPVSFSVCASIC